MIRRLFRKRPIILPDDVRVVHLTSFRYAQKAAVEASRQLENERKVHERYLVDLNLKHQRNELK